MSGDATSGSRSASSPCLADEFGPNPSLDASDPARVTLWRRRERERLRTARLALAVAARAAIEAALARHLDSLLAARLGDIAGRVVSGFWPIKGEPDLRGWPAGLDAKGAVVALPVVEERGAPLAFRRWRPGMALERGHWNIPVPPASAGTLRPEAALAPLLGWDDEGYRLGYGGGYFDRTLAALVPRPLVIGVGLQAARLDSILPQPHDIPMSIIVTEASLQAEGRGDS